MEKEIIKNIQNLSTKNPNLFSRIKESAEKIGIHTNTVDESKLDFKLFGEFMAQVMENESNHQGCCSSSEKESFIDLTQEDIIDLTHDSLANQSSSSSVKRIKKYRVREILKAFKAKDRKKAVSFLPSQSEVCPIDLTTFRYPNALLGVLPKDEKYSLLGLISEDLLQMTSKNISVTSLCVVLADKYGIPTDSIAKVKKSKTTSDFLGHIIETRKKLENVNNGYFLYDQELSNNLVQGHPDIMTKTQIFEIKCTGQLEKNWTDFILQVFAYGSLSSDTYTDLYLVLPLQETVWHVNISNWKTKKEYLAVLESVANNLQNPSSSSKKQVLTVDDIMPGMLLRDEFSIGNHTSKQKNLYTTVVQLVEKDGIERPFQIFLAGNQTSKMHIADTELIQTGEFVNQTGLRLFIHSQYIINLCAEPYDKDDYHVKTLVKNLEYGKITGCKGVVVHVGKYTDKPLDIALQNMKSNLLRAMESATKECPILLETPAGQGTETLTKLEDFFQFVKSFNDPRIQICIDTCHVFSLGYDSLEYIKTITELDPEIVKLVHYNDSASVCGSCVDRHAFIGTGNIGIVKMRQIAEYCTSKNYCMIIE